MTWNFNPNVVIGGTDVSSKVINSISVTCGRNSYWEQARAGYATIEIVNWDNSDYGFEINDSVIIRLDDISLIPTRVFTGKVTSISTQMQAVGSVKEISVITLSAVGPFAQMSRTIIGGSGYLREMDDVRMTNILTDAGVTIDTVDTPGIYEFDAADALPYRCLSMG